MVLHNKRIYLNTDVHGSRSYRYCNYVTSSSAEAKKYNAQTSTTIESWFNASLLCSIGGWVVCSGICVMCVTW